MRLNSQQTIEVLTEGNRIDWFFLGLVSALSALGLVMVFSASVAQAERVLEDATYFGRLQFIYLMIGLVSAFVVSRIPLDVMEKYSPVLLAIGFVLLVLVLVPFIGKSVNGSRRWIQLGLSFQPSEFFKLAIVFYLAGYFVRKGGQIRTDVKVFLMPLGIAAGAAIVLLAEPDFGATVVVVATIVAMMFVAGCRIRHFSLCMLVVIPLAFVAIILSPYRKSRLLSFVNPWDDPFATDFQLTQSLIAVGRGSWDGVGLGNSVQKMAYLPEAHTDFVFAVFAEEFGFIGVTLLLVLFALIVARCFRIARDADRAGLVFGAHLATGIGFWFGFQAFINIGANMGVLPTKGITLPLFSYGGSSVLAVCVACGVVLRVSWETLQQTENVLSRSVTDRVEVSLINQDADSV